MFNLGSHTLHGGGVSGCNANDGDDSGGLHDVNMIWFAKENAENYEDWIVKKYRGLRIPAFILAQSHLLQRVFFS